MALIMKRILSAGLVIKLMVIGILTGNELKQMKKILIIFFCTLVVALGSAGSEIRVVSLAPALTELVCHLNKGENLVGRSSACDYPRSVKNLPVVGKFGTPEVERIVALRPTLVIGNDLMNFNVVRKLRELKIEVIIRNVDTVEDYCFWVETLGDKLNCREAAAAEHARVKQQLQTLENMPPLAGSLLWVVNGKPLMVAGKGSLSDLVMNLLKIRNAAASAPKAYYKCSQEWLLRNQPDIVVWAIPGAPNARRGIWKNIPAVQKNRVIKNVSRHPVMRPGPRFLESVIEFRKNLERL